MPMQATDIKKSFNMTNDKTRNLFYYKALENVENKVVIDVGSGTGILSAYALHHGAKFVYAIERGQKESIVAKKLLGENFDTKKFTVLNKDFWSKDIFTNFQHDIDILVSETINYDVIGEGILKTWRHTKPNVSSHFQCVPNTIQMDALIYKNPMEKFAWLKQKLQLIPENLLHNGFATSLHNMHKKISNSTTQHFINFPVRDMANFDEKVDNVIDISYDKYNGEDITFNLTVNCPSLIVLSGKILSNNNILHLHDPTNTTHWSSGLSFYFNKAGTYKVNFIEDAKTNLVKWTNDDVASKIWPYNCSWTYTLTN